MPSGRRYDLVFHHEFPKDLEGLPHNIQERILRAIESRLSDSPERYGERLRQSLQGFWKLRVGDFRVVFKLVREQVRIYGVMNRREVYTQILRRTARGWPENPSRT